MNRTWMCELLRAPWLAFTFADLDWNWLVRNAKLHDRQNRLGFTATLAKELAWRVGDQNRMDNLSQKESLLQPSLLAKEDTYCHDSLDRKSTRLNSSHVAISYAVFCLKKK